MDGNAPQVIRIVGIQTSVAPRDTGQSSIPRGNECRMITLQNGESSTAAATDPAITATAVRTSCSGRNATTGHSSTVTISNGGGGGASGSGGRQKTVPSILSSGSDRRKLNPTDGTFIIERKIPLHPGKRVRIDKKEKGLRHFSMKVSEKVREKGVTTYNEVADELVEEFTKPNSGPNGGPPQYEQKNVRRRVYDALNVLMAMDIISKERKEIKWIGLPNNSMQEALNLEHEKMERLTRIRQKTERLHEIITNQIAFKQLVARNVKDEKDRGPPASTSAVKLPFYLVNTDRQTVIDCCISNDRTQYVFTFDNQYQVNDDTDVLKLMGLDMGLGKEPCSPEVVLNAKNMVPEVLRKYVTDVAMGKTEMTLQELEEDIAYTELLLRDPLGDGDGPSKGITGAISSFDGSELMSSDEDDPRMLTD